MLDDPIAVPFSVIAIGRHQANPLHRRYRECVLLGAVWDTFAQANPYPGLEIFEINHPSSERGERNLLVSIQMVKPNKIHYVSIDFERQSIASARGSCI